MKVSIVDKGEIPGLDELEPLLDEGLWSDDFLARAKEELVRQKPPIEVTKGVATKGLGDDLNAFIDRFRKRRLLEAKPEEVHPIPWLELHVPKHGTASLTTIQDASTERAVEFALFGSGIGRGRKAKLTFEETSDKRKDCASYLVRVKVRPLIYQVKNDKVVVLDVVGIAGEAVESYSQCPYCGITSKDIDPSKYKTGPYLDYSKDTVEHQCTYSIERVRDLNMKLGINIPGLQDSKLSLSAKMSCGMTWKVKYSFEPGRLYQPYWRTSGIPPHSPMWTTG